MSLKRKQRLGFTLPEMLVVIVILVIMLLTGKFYYDQMTINSRDSKRISDLKSIEIWLSTYKAYRKVYPKPSDYTKIEKWWKVSSYQWEFWKTLRDITKLTRLPVDPLNKSSYIYALNRTKSEYQLLSFLENKNNNLDVSETASASKVSYLNRIPFTTWEPIWIILKEDNSPINDTESILDLTTDTTNTYKIVYKDYLIWEWKWWEFDFPNNEFKSCYDIKLAWAWKKSGLYSIVPDGKNPIKVYCDMQTAWGWWTLAMRVYSDRDYLTSSPLWELSSPEQKTTAKLSDEIINKIRTENVFMAFTWSKNENKLLLKNHYTTTSDWDSTLNQPQMDFACLNEPNKWTPTTYSEMNKNYVRADTCSFTSPTDINWEPLYFTNSTDYKTAFLYSDARHERSCWFTHCPTPWDTRVAPWSIWVK